MIRHLRGTKRASISTAAGRMVGALVLAGLITGVLTGCEGATDSRFAACQSADLVGIESVSSGPGYVRIVGSTGSSVEHYRRTVSEQRGDVLLVGFIFTPLDTESNLGTFDVRVPVSGRVIREVRVVGGDKERRIK